MMKIYLIIGALVLVLAVVFGTTADTDFFSCNKCRGLKTVRMFRTFGLTWHTTEHISIDENPDPKCQHEWWNYSRGSARIFMSSVACKTHMYKDENEVSNKASPAIGAKTAPQPGR
jgi:hypothetical protein